MKKITFQLALLTILLWSCKAQINENELIGTWKVIEFNSDTPELSPRIIESAKVEALSSFYSFQNEKTFTKKSDYYSGGIKGKYQFIVENSLIKMISDTGNGNEIEEYRIESLNSNSMTWTQDMGELGSLSMTLEKE